MSEIYTITPTYDRAESLVRTVRSVLREPNTVAVVIDQHPERKTQAYLLEQAQDVYRNSRFEYNFSHKRGEGVARNLGIKRNKPYFSTDDLVVCIDDDVEVLPGWSGQIRDVVQAHPRAGIISAAEVRAFEPEEGEMIPEFKPDHPEKIITPDVKVDHWGISAHMMIRPWVFDEIGFFDPLLGSGSRFGSADDMDFIYRAMAADIQVMTVQKPEVLHYGVRKNEEIKELYNRYAYGFGAMWGKMFQCNDGEALRMFFEIMQSHLRRAGSELLHTGRPKGIGGAYHFGKGFYDGANTPIDKEKRVFIAE